MLSLASSWRPLSQTVASVASPSKPMTALSPGPGSGASKTSRYHQSVPSKFLGAPSSDQSPSERSAAAAGIGASIGCHRRGEAASSSGSIPGAPSQTDQAPGNGLRASPGFKLEQINVVRSTHEPVALPEYL